MYLMLENIKQDTWTYKKNKDITMYMMPALLMLLFYLKQNNIDSVENIQSDKFVRTSVYLKEEIWFYQLSW